MKQDDLHAVTGAFGYSGKYIAYRLLADGKSVITLTNSIHRQSPFGDRVRAVPFCFDKPEKLTESLYGVSVLYNTYWVRFNHRSFTHADAVRNTMALFEAAKAAGVKRVVHVSITNPSEDSPLEYFSGKARLERALVESGLSHAILRPTVLFGKEDILVNNIAWALRHLPVFGVFGDGQYKLQPIYVDDLAEIAVEQGGPRENVVINAVGPETFTYRGLVETIGQIIGKAASGDLGCSRRRICRRLDHRKTRRRCDDHQGRNCRFDGQPALCSIAACRSYKIDRLGEGAVINAGPALYQ